MKKTIYLMGGFGNVLFQLNYGYYLQEHKGYDVSFATILISSNKILNKILNWSDHKTLETIKQLSLNEEIKLINGSLFDLFFLNLSKLFKKQFFGYVYNGLNRNPSNEKTCHTFLGYYHEDIPISVKLTKTIKDLGLKYINKQTKLYKDKIALAQNNCILHYRAGDYLSQEYRKINDNYFIKATENENIIYVISNDDNYANKYLNSIIKEVKFHYLSDESALDDFVLIMNSKKIVLSNSTFSWWASECSDAEIIFQPEPFFSHLNWQPQTNKNRIKLGTKNES
jgi:hypothetical protein